MKSEGVGSIRAGKGDFPRSTLNFTTHSMLTFQVCHALVNCSLVNLTQRQLEKASSPNPAMAYYANQPVSIKKDIIRTLG